MTSKHFSPEEQSSASIGHIVQVTWCHLQSGRNILVLTSTRGLQMYDEDGLVLVFTHRFSIQEQSEAAFARGICSLGDNIFTGTSSGDILVFSVPATGKLVTHVNTLEDHSYPIYDIHAIQDGRFVSCDESGRMVLWDSMSNFEKIGGTNGDGTPCTSVCLWNNLVVGGYGSGHIRIFSATTGKMMVEIAAHARWIHAIDIAQESGLVVSCSEDSFVKVWRLPHDGETDVKLIYSETVDDVQLVGVKFCDKQGSMFAVTGYDLAEIRIFKK